MSLTEQKNDLDWLEEITNGLSKRYVNKFFGKYLCFISDRGAIFKPFSFPGRDALGIEYADVRDSEAYLFEDGDLFYIKDYESPDDMLRDMMKEIDE